MNRRLQGPAVAFLVIVASLCLQSSLQVDAHLVTSLPDAPAFNFTMYSGYLEIPNTSFKMHYSIEESLNDPVNDPVLFWFNGGPGCSSLTGQFTELGYFMESADGTEWVANENSWNHFANVVFVESPAGVGFSTMSDEDAEIPYSDYSVAELNLLFTKAFFEAYPNLVANSLYLTGESYAGIYIPYLAYLIDLHNTDLQEGDTHYNLKGFMIGNGVTDFNVDAEKAMVEYLSGHAILSPTFRKRSEHENCWFSMKTHPHHKGQHIAEARPENHARCEELTYELNQALAHVNPYNLLDDCHGSDDTNSPCLGLSLMDSYLQRDDVREALNVSEFTGQWSSCSDPIFYAYIRILPGTIQFYPHLISQNYKILKYSGDADSVVSFVGTEKWIESLELGVSESWRQWSIESDPNQPAGFIQVYNGLTYATIRNAGHMVPQNKGPQMSHLISNFISGDDI
mmetsp:Transcript_54550/g.62537  ORF Transcript_54550/g.62537 Transcript_54550/m.62537 type:complete len:455 (+) Transcript_54550:69-1433(+)